MQATTYRGLIAAGLLFGLWGAADAALPRMFGYPRCNPTPIYGVGCGWCPDDYCYKQAPCDPPLPPCGCANDYCGKAMPCPPPRAPCGYANDYCPKPPVACPRNCEPWYRCVPMCWPGSK